MILEKKSFIFWITYIPVLVIFTEMFAYVWHRYIAHNHNLSGVHDTHEIHHLIELEMGNESHEDFIWLLFLIIIVELMLGVAVMLNIIPATIAIVTILVTTGVFLWNWWIHQAYHNDSHWLNNYEWFQREKKRHYIHHYNPRNNYGIASHFSDIIMGTWCDVLY